MLGVSSCCIQGVSGTVSAGRLLGACETAGELFIMMEYLDGGTLVDLL